MEGQFRQMVSRVHGFEHGLTCDLQPRKRAQGRPKAKAKPTPVPHRAGASSSKDVPVNFSASPCRKRLRLQDRQVGVQRVRYAETFGSSSSSTASGSQQGEAEWPCLKCTFRNRPTLLECEICH